MLAVAPPEKKLGALFRLAIRSGAADAVALHIRRGEPVNGRDGAGLTPLMLAAVHDRLDVCMRLLDAGADATLTTVDGFTAGSMAVELGHAAVADLLSSHASTQPRLASDANPAPEALVPQIIALVPSVVPDSSTGPAIVDALVDDLNGWVADETVEAPRHDAECVAAVRETQRAMSTHRRVSDEVDWSDIDIDLPEVLVQAPSISHGQLAAVEALIASGLDSGFVNPVDLWSAADADCGHDIERAYEVLLRVFDDAGILVEPFAPNGASHGSMDADELNELLEFVVTELPAPPDPAAAYGAQARKVELIKREDEERLGRRMDSALGGLTRALASLSEDGWQLAFPTDAAADACDVPAEEDDDSELPVEQPTSDDIADGDEQIDFGAYVALVRSGMPEYGREMLVPRPRPSELSRLLGLVSDMEPDTANAVVSSIAAYEKARDQLVTANLRLAMSVAYGYRYRGHPLEDLIQDANLGLMRAAEKFDFRRGYKFSTYATNWVRQSVTRALADTLRLIRVPVHMVEKFNAVHRARRELEFGRKRAVTIDEIAQRLSMSPEALRRIVRWDREVLSLEECGQDGQPGTPEPLSIVDPDADPYGVASRQSLSRLIERMLGDCKEKQREVLVLRFGLDGTDGMKLEEIGQKLDLTRERIRQIESKALSVFRHSSRLDQLLPFAGATGLSDY